MSVRRYGDGMLELGRERAVACDGGPPVVEHLHVEPPGVDHRLNGEEHAFAQQWLFLTLGVADLRVPLATTVGLSRADIVQHAGRRVEHAPEAVATEILDDGEDRKSTRLNSS